MSYDAEAIILVRNKGQRFKLGLAMVITRKDAVTDEAKAAFDRVASKLLLVGHLPQITRFVLESE